MRWLAIVSLVGIACSSQSSSPDAAIHDAKVVDAPPDGPAIDAPPPTALTIAVNDVVEFMMASNHNVVPDATMSDTGLHVNFGETKCLKFTVAGEFHFHCQPHGFHGVITAN